VAGGRRRRADWHLHEQKRRVARRLCDRAQFLQGAPAAAVAARPARSISPAAAAAAAGQTRPWSEVVAFFDEIEDAAYVVETDSEPGRDDDSAAAAESRRGQARRKRSRPEAMPKTAAAKTLAGMAGPAAVAAKKLKAHN
jgi:hypothetical protein